MNYFDLIIGLGLGVLITLIIRAVNGARKEKKASDKKKEDQVLKGIDSLSDQLCEQHNHFNSIEERFQDIVIRIEKLESRRK